MNLSWTVRDQEDTNQQEGSDEFLFVKSHAETQAAGHSESISNAFTGVYGSTETTTSQLVSWQETFNTIVDPISRAEVVVHGRTDVQSTSESTATRAGNSVRQDFSLSVDTTTTPSKTIETTDNQTLHTRRELDTRTENLHSESGNSISGQLTTSDQVTTTNTAVGQDRADNQTYHSVTNILQFASRDNASTTANTITGIYRTQYDTSTDTTFDETIRNQTLQTLAPVVTSSSGTVGTREGNSILSNYTIVDETVNTEQHREETSTNQTLRVTSTLDSSSETLTVDSSGNSITGAFAQSTTTTGQSTRDETSTNTVANSAAVDITETNHVVTTNEMSGTSQRSGNSLTGQFQSLDDATDIAHRDESLTNQTLAVTTIVDATTRTTTDVAGNSVTGVVTRHVVEVPQSETTRNDTSRNTQLNRDGIQVIDVMTTKTTTPTSITSRTQSSGNSILGIYTGDSSVVTLANLETGHTNQTLQAAGTSVEDSTAVTEDFVRNDITGQYHGTTVTTGSRTRGETVTNQSLQAAEDATVTEFQITTTSDTNSITGAYQEQTSTQDRTHTPDGRDTNGPLSVQYDQTVTIESESDRTGNTVVGDYTQQGQSTTVTQRARSTPTAWYPAASRC